MDNNRSITTTQGAGWTAALTPATTEDAWKVAQSLAKSQFVPKGFQGQPAEILIAASIGARLELYVFSSLQSLAVVNGRPTLYGDAMLGICQQRPDWRGMSVAWSGQGDAECCTVTIKRADPSGSVNATEGRFGVTDAKKAGLWTKQGPWSQYPRRMMEMRARAYALRGAFADALMGFHAREEMEDVQEADVVAVHGAGRRARVREVAPAIGQVIDSSAPTQSPGQPADAPQEPPVAVEQPANDPATVPATGGADLPSEDDLRQTVNDCAARAGGSKAVVAEIQRVLGYEIANAASVKPEDRARAILTARQVAGLEA